MPSDGLIDARIAENKAQRKYDLRVVFFTAALAMLALAIPVLGGYLALLDARISQDQQAAETNARFYEDRSSEALLTCLNTDLPTEITRIYCDQFWSRSDLAVEMWGLAGSYGDTTSSFGIIVLSLIGIAVCIFLLIYRPLVAASHRLEDAHVKRMRAEAVAEGSVRQRSARRVAGQRRL